MSNISKWLTLVFCSFFLAACQTTPASPAPLVQEVSPSPTETAISPVASPSATSKSSTELLNLKPNQKMFAYMKTSLGTIKLELFFDKTPETVANFVGLSEGTKDWTDPKTDKKIFGKSLYAGTIFHRIIKDFMIQGGDPLGSGTGGPGYRFADEFDPKLTFEKAGILAMANSGPNTNGSQFFITSVPTTWLNGKHTIFGKVADPASMTVVNKIAQSATDSGDKPVKPIVIDSVTIERI